MNKLVFLSGIHGVGKTTLTNKLKNDLKIDCHSVSSLIKKSGASILLNKKTKNIDSNQDKWKDELQKLQISNNKILLIDGHFCLLDEKNKIVELPLDILDGTDTNKIILMKRATSIIQERLFKRDNKLYSIDKLDCFQKKEERMAKKIAVQKNIPLYIYDENASYNALIKFIRK